MTAIYSMGKKIYNLGYVLIEDDKADLGYFSYTGRKDHYYHGKYSPDHPSPWHHWQVGGALIVLGQLLGYAGIMQEMMNEERQEQQQQQSVVAANPQYFPSLSTPF